MAFTRKHQAAQAVLEDLALERVLEVVAAIQARIVSCKASPGADRKDTFAALVARHTPMFAAFKEKAGEGVAHAHSLALLMS